MEKTVFFLGFSKEVQKEPPKAGAQSGIFRAGKVSGNSGTSIKKS